MADPAPRAPENPDEAKTGTSPEDGLSPHPFRWSTVGIEFSIGILVLGFLGWLGDGWIGWRDVFPTCTVVGVFVGFGWGIWRLQRALGGRRPPRS